MPKLSRVLETALYVADLDKAATFYADVFLPAVYAILDDGLAAAAARLMAMGDSGQNK